MGGYLSSIAGVKVIALWLIFLVHSSIPIPRLNPASRCVELFFVISGFLTYYASDGREIPCTYAESFRIMKQKLIRILPLYLIGYMYYLVISRPKGSIAVLNLFMLQSWSDSSEVFFSLNGPSWYIASLMFCYFLSPLGINIVRKLNHPMLAIGFLGMLRFVIEFLLTQDDKIIALNVHVSPIIRNFDFIMGMCAAVIYFKRKFVHKIVLSSILEIGVVSGVLILDYCWGEVLPKTIFVVCFCFMCIVYAYNSGILSKFLSCKVFKYFSEIQLEFYLLHAPVGSFVYLILGLFIPILRSNIYVKASLSFALIVVCSYVYKCLLKKPMESFFDNIAKRV